MTAVEADENHGDGWGLTWFIYLNYNLNPLNTFSSSSRSTVFKDILPWNMSQMITKSVPISTRIVISNAMKWGIPLCIWWKVNGNWDNGGKAIVEQIASWERNKSKRAGLWESQSGIRVEKLTIWIRSFDYNRVNYKNYNRVHQIYQFHQNR